MILTTCKYFEGTGNFCSRVTAMRCDEFPECEFKYIEELKAENVEIKTSYINFIAKLKREMITKDDIQDLKDTAKRFVEERNSLRKENVVLKAENARLKEENKTLEQFLSKEPLALQALQKGYASYKKSTDVFYEMVKTYKQTLQEIKEIAEDECKDCSDKGTDSCWICPYYPILNIITKAESEG